MYFQKGLLSEGILHFKVGLRCKIGDLVGLFLGGLMFGGAYYQKFSVVWSHSFNCGSSHT